MSIVVKRKPGWLTWDVIVALILGVGMLAGQVWYYHKHPPPPDPCAKYANTPQKDIPGRCLYYWMPRH